MMRLEEERVGDVSWLMLCVCCIAGLIGLYGQYGDPCDVLYGLYLILCVLRNGSRTAVMLFVCLLTWKYF